MTGNVANFAAERNVVLLLVLKKNPQPAGAGRQRRWLHAGVRTVSGQGMLGV